jgi:hypothetical protein
MILDAFVTIVLLGIVLFVGILVLFSTLFIITISPLFVLVYGVLNILKPQRKQ